jgi:hypothetical protein
MMIGIRERKRKERNGEMTLTLIALYTAAARSERTVPFFPSMKLQREQHFGFGYDTTERDLREATRGLCMPFVDDEQVPITTLRTVLQNTR